MGKKCGDNFFQNCEIKLWIIYLIDMFSKCVTCMQWFPKLSVELCEEQMQSVRENGENSTEEKSTASRGMLRMLTSAYKTLITKVFRQQSQVPTLLFTCVVKASSTLSADGVFSIIIHKSLKITAKPTSACRNQTGMDLTLGAGRGGENGGVGGGEKRAWKKEPYTIWNTFNS